MYALYYQKYQNQRRKLNTFIFSDYTVHQNITFSFQRDQSNIAIEISTDSELCPTIIITSRVIYRAQYHLQDCTIQVFEQSGALCVHNPDYNHLPARIRTQHLLVLIHNRTGWAI